MEIEHLLQYSDIAMQVTDPRTNLKQMAKRANQRLLRLEREASKNLDEDGKPIKGEAHELAEYYLGKRGRKRWSERVATLALNEVKEQLVEIANFLNTDTSKIKEYKKFLEFRNSILKEMEEYNELRTPEEENSNANRLKGLGKVVNGLSGKDANTVIDLIRVAHKVKLDKVFGYRTIAKAIGMMLDNKMSRYAMVKMLSDAAKDKDITRTKFLKNIRNYHPRKK